MKTPDFKELYEPYSAKATLEETLSWLIKECVSKGISTELAQKAFNFTFLELADGKTFPLDGGDTGFTDIPHAAMNIHMLKMAMGFHKKSTKAYLEATQGVLQARINTHIRRSKNREYIEHLKRNSPIVRLFVRNK